MEQRTKEKTERGSRETHVEKLPDNAQSLEESTRSLQLYDDTEK